MSKKNLPASLQTLDGDPDAGGVATAEAPETTTEAKPFQPPGQLPPPLPPAQLPSAGKQHYYQVFPTMAPRKSTTPGVWLRPDGTPYTPRKRIGGQFSVMLVRIANNYAPDDKPRQAVFELNHPVDQYGVQEFETVTERIEVIFDFEDEMLACLKAFKRPSRAADPLGARLAERGLAGYDDAATTPGLTPLVR